MNELIAEKNEVVSQNDEAELSDERVARVCVGVASAACLSCAIRNECPILRMRNFAEENLQPAPERESYLEELLDDDNDGIIVAGYERAEDSVIIEVEQRSDAVDDADDSRSETLEAEIIDSSKIYTTIQNHENVEVREERVNEKEGMPEKEIAPLPNSELREVTHEKIVKMQESADDSSNDSVTPIPIQAQEIEIPETLEKHIKYAEVSEPQQENTVRHEKDEGDSGHDKKELARHYKQTSPKEELNSVHELIDAEKDESSQIEPEEREVATEKEIEVTSQNVGEENFEIHREESTIVDEVEKKVETHEMKVESSEEVRIEKENDFTKTVGNEEQRQESCANNSPEFFEKPPTLDFVEKASSSQQADQEIFLDSPTLPEPFENQTMQNEELPEILEQTEDLLIEDERTMDEFVSDDEQSAEIPHYEDLEDLNDETPERVIPEQEIIIDIRQIKKALETADIADNFEHTQQVEQAENASETIAKTPQELSIETTSEPEASQTSIVEIDSEQEIQKDSPDEDDVDVDSDSQSPQPIRSRKNEQQNTAEEPLEENREDDDTDPPPSPQPYNLFAILSHMVGSLAVQRVVS